MCEINSHGGTVVEKRILEECLKNGAILAEPGEFTKRAFLNGRIDLSQAESIIDIINSKTEKEARASVNQLKGYLSNNILKIKKDLLSIMADIEANIDYPEYDIEEVSNKRAINVLEDVRNELKALENSFSSGKVLKLTPPSEKGFAYSPAINITIMLLLLTFFMIVIVTLT